MKAGNENLPISNFHILPQFSCPKDFKSSITAPLSDENSIVLGDSNTQSLLYYTNIPEDQSGTRLEAEIIESTFTPLNDYHETRLINYFNFSVFLVLRLASFIKSENRIFLSMFNLNESLGCLNSDKFKFPETQDIFCLRVTTTPGMGKVLCRIFFFFRKKFSNALTTDVHSCILMHWTCTGVHMLILSSI